MEDLKKIISRVLNIDINKITDGLSREKTEEWDSFNHLLLISEIEKEMNIKFTMSEVEKINDFKGLAETINKKLNGNKNERV